MIKSNWKKYLDKAGRSQNSLADQVGVDRGAMSRACSGIGILPYEALEECSSILQCRPKDIYDDVTMQILYQTAQAEKKKLPSTVTVRIKQDIADAVDALVDEGLYLSRNEAVNRLLGKALL